MRRFQGVPSDWKVITVSASPFSCKVDVVCEADPAQVFSLLLGFSFFFFFLLYFILDSAAPKAPAAAAPGAGGAGGAEPARTPRTLQPRSAQRGGADLLQTRTRGRRAGGILQAPLFNGLDISSPSSSFIPRSDKPISTSRSARSEELRAAGAAEDPRRRPRHRAPPGTGARGAVTAAVPAPGSADVAGPGGGGAAREERSPGGGRAHRQSGSPGSRKLPGCPR